MRIPLDPQRLPIGSDARIIRGRKWHKSPDSYDDRALGEIPPRDHYSKDPDVGSDPRPSATGTPAGVRSYQDGVV